MRGAYERLKDSFEKQGKPLPENRGKRRDRDCMVFNFLATEIMQGRLDTIRSLFREGEEVYPGTEHCAQQHIQICVRNPSSILEIKLASRGET